MQFEGFNVEPFHTTLMGVAKAVLDFYGCEVSAPMAFGATGHAFLINVHRELCPSGPYCWNRSGFDRLLGNLGLEMQDRGFFSPASRAADRAALEATLRAALDRGDPCSLVNLDHQLITGYDDAGFFTTRPWPSNPDYPPARLSFGSWQELGSQFHVSFYTFAPVEPADIQTAIRESLEYAVDLYRSPTRYSWEGYGIGPDAYANWIAGVEAFGAGQGSEWNATVWAECRQMAADYFTEIRELFPAVSPPAAELAWAYREIAQLLNRVRDREMDPAEKVSLLKSAAEQEAIAIEAVACLAAEL